MSRWAALRRPPAAEQPRGWAAVAQRGSDGDGPGAPTTAGAKLWAHVEERVVLRRVVNRFAKFDEEMRREEKRERRRELRRLAAQRGWCVVVGVLVRDARREAGAALHKLWRTLQSEHTIVSAVLPSDEDTSGSHLRDENVVQIFFTTLLAELCVLCAMRGGEEVPLLSLTTIIGGLITTTVCTVLASICKVVFRWGNKRRWRKRQADERPPLARRIVRLALRPLLAPCRWLRGGRDSVALRRAERRKRKAREARESNRLTFDPRTGRWSTYGDATRRGGSKGGGKPSMRLKATTASLLKRRAPRGTRGASSPAAVQQALESRRFKPMNRRLHLLRFLLAWLLNLAVYLAACIVSLTYGVLFEPPALRELLFAWLAALVFTWLVVEPGEIVGMVLFPRLFNNRRIAACRAKCKELGIYG